jgi:dolichol-phosphate mannosyltransferase
MDIAYEVVFRIDPSPDRTKEIILEDINRNSAIKLLVFSRRIGQPDATRVEIIWSRSEMCVTIDEHVQTSRS